jgi:hypothetical protein
MREEEKDRELKYTEKKQWRVEGSLFRPSTGAQVPEFTLARQTCLSIPNREPFREKKSRNRAAGKGPCGGGGGGGINRWCATAIRLIEIQVFPAVRSCCLKYSGGLHNGSYAAPSS